MSTEPHKMGNDSGGAMVMMPTSADYTGPDDTGYQKKLKSRLAGTDQWNDQILRAGLKTGVNPVMLKILMATESSGNKDIGSSSAGAIGIMQIMPSWGFDEARLRSDVDYALESAAAVLKAKVAENKNRQSAQGDGGPSSIKNTARGYIGWGAAGAPYAEQVAQMAEGFGLSGSLSVLAGHNADTTWSGLDTGLAGVNTYGDITQGRIYETAEGGIDGTYEGPAFDGIAGVYEKPAFVPPHYYEDDFAELPHRYAQGEYFLRIGDSRFVIPPTQISVSETSNITTSNTLRQKQSMKIQSGSNMRNISLTLMFTDFEQVNGYEMQANNGTGEVYYMDGLRSLIAQMKTMPFLPVENEYLNFVHDIYAVALLSCHVSVVAGFPGMLKAELTLTEFDPEPFLYKPAWLYDSHFVWPLYRWHYQRLLSGRTQNIDTLAPYIGDGILNFWYLNEGALTEHRDEVIAESDKELKEGDRYVSWWDFNSKLEKDINHNKLFKHHEIPPDYQIIDISGSFGNTLAPLTPSLTGKPVFQYFGSQDAKFNVLLQTSSREVLYLLKNLKDTLDRYAREYRNGFVSSMLRIENNFINMFGVTGVLIEAMNIQSIEGSPGEFYVSLDMISFDETQHVDEKLGHLTTIDFDKILGSEGPENVRDAKNGLKDGEGPETSTNLAAEMEGGTLQGYDNHIRHAVSAEKQLDKLELYPDLELPSPQEVIDVVDKINVNRAEKGLKVIPEGNAIGPVGASFVDPDFFFSYPPLDELIADIEVTLKKSNIKRLAADQGIEFTEGFLEEFERTDVQSFFGGKSKDLIDKHVDREFLMDSFEELAMNDPHELANQWQEIRGVITDPARYTKRFWTKSWSGDGGEWKASGTQMNSEVDNDWVRFYFDKQEARATVKSLSATERYHGMLHDMIKYDKRGTMMRAFPSYVFVIIDEGIHMNIHKLWDNYYTYHAISEINVHMDRKSPIHTAYIKLSNIYGALENKGKYYHKLTTPSKMEVADGFFKGMIGVHDVKERELLERALVYDSILLLAGARIHIRAGYGSMASQLPVLFNGIISEIDTGDVVTVVAQSFGHELTAEIPADPNENTSVFKEGLEPTEMFRYYMSERKGNYTWAWRKSGEPGKYQSAYGIDHFGFLRVRDEQQFTDFFSGLHWNQERSLNAEDYDIMKNIYSTIGYAKTGVDEGSVVGTLETADQETAREEAEYDKNNPPSFIAKDTAKEILEANKEMMPMSYKWASKTPDLTEMTIDGKQVTKKLTKKSHVEKYMKLFKKANKEDGDSVNISLQKQMVDATYWWAANPETTPIWGGEKKHSHSWSGNDSMGMREKVIDLIGPIKKINTELYDEALAILTAIIQEWDDATNGRKNGNEVKIIGIDNLEGQQGATAGVQGSVGSTTETDEENVRMQIDGKAPWDVFRTIQRVSPEYIVYPHPHQFHYTLFFGKPSWDVQCGYVLPPSDTTDDMYGRKISDYVELSKPFSQMHFYSSYGDIIANNIKVVGDNLTTAVLPIYAIDETDKTYDIAWADYYIRGSQQKTKTVDTTLVANIAVMPTWMESIGAWVGGLGSGTKYQRHSIKFAQGVVADSFKDMYQGELLVFGDPSVKPHDIMYLDDYNKKMSGTAEVGRVTHSMSVETGFFTSIKPDLVVALNPEPTRHSADWIGEPSLSSDGLYRAGEVVTLGTLKSLQIMSVYALVKVTKQNQAWARFASIARTGRAGTSAATLGTRWIQSVTGTKMLKPVKATVTFIRSGTAVGRGIGTGATAILRFARFGVLIPGPGWLLTAIAVASFAATTILIKMVENIFIQKFNNVIKIFPLFLNEKPFVAGINGHKMLIPGWQDNGSGKPVRVRFDNVDVFDPPTIWDKLSKFGGAYADSFGDQGSMGGPTSATSNSTTVSGVTPAEFLSKIPAAAQNTGSLYCSPVALGREGKGLAGLTSRASSNFGPRGSRLHAGTDFRRGAPSKKNDLVYTFGAGRVIYAGEYTGFGTYVFIEHKVPQGAQGTTPYVFYTGYGHFELKDIKVKTGQAVGKRTLIGKMGNEGDSEGHHLHFEVIVSKNPAAAVERSVGKATVSWAHPGLKHSNDNGQFVDPMLFIKEMIAYQVDIIEYIDYKG